MIIVIDHLEMKLKTCKGRLNLTSDLKQHVQCDCSAILDRGLEGVDCRVGPVRIDQLERPVFPLDGKVGRVPSVEVLCPTPPMAEKDEDRSERSTGNFC